MDPIILIIGIMAGCFAAFQLVMAIIKTKWITVPDAICTECDWNHGKLSYNNLSLIRKKRYYQAGYRAAFEFWLNDQQHTGKQLMPYNPGKYEPGMVYTIKVNPKRPHMVATRQEIVWGYVTGILFTILATVIILNAYNII